MKNAAQPGPSNKALYILITCHTEISRGWLASEASKLPEMF